MSMNEYKVRSAEALERIASALETKNGGVDVSKIHDWALWFLGDNGRVLDAVQTDSLSYAAGVLAVCDLVVGVENSIVTEMLMMQMEEDQENMKKYPEGMVDDE